MHHRVRPFVKDIAPSVVVFLIALPLSMGIARASGMPASLGLITAVVGGVVVGFLGQWPSLMGRYTRGGIRAAARRSIPPSHPPSLED